MTNDSLDAWRLLPSEYQLTNGCWSLGDNPKYTLRVEESKEEKTVAQEVMEARDFVRETTRNAWVPDDMKRKIEKHITKLCNAIECQERSLQEMTDKHIKLRGELKFQQDILSSILKLRLDFERINPVPTMSKLTKQCIDAYNTCIELQKKMLDKTLSELTKENKERKTE